MCAVRRALVGARPGLVRVELGDGCCLFRGIRAEVLLVNDSIVINDEGHHAGTAVLRGIGEEGNAAGQLPVDGVIARAAFRRRALAGEETEDVAAKRIRLPLLARIAFISRAGQQRPYGTGGLAAAGLPVEPILLSLIAE